MIAISRLVSVWIVLAACSSVTAATDSGPSQDLSTTDGPEGGLPCRSDRECTAGHMVCDRATERCVECIVRTDCIGDNLTCRGNHCVTAVPCTTSRTCPGQLCNPTLGYCVDCLAEADCTDGQVCRSSTCVPAPRACTSTRQCTDIDQVCDSTAGHCVDCVMDVDCMSGLFCQADGTCAVQVCTPGATACVNTVRIRSCNSRGSAWEEALCPMTDVCSDGRCQTRICTPGEASCASPGERRLCNTDGLGYATTACTSTETCTGGACVPRTCTPGTTDCASATSRRVCNMDGLGYTTSPCGAMQGCSAGACVSWTCTPGAATCASFTTRSVCNMDGLGSTPTECPAMNSCRDGVCRVQVCSPGDSTCADSRNVRVCDDDGLGSRTIACTAMAACSGGRCTGWVCTPGEASCTTMGERRQCNPDGLGYTTMTCAAPANASSARCDGGACTLTCAAGFGDCNRTFSDGCEVALATSPANCGTCGHACPSGQACVAGACTTPPAQTSCPMPAELGCGLVEVTGGMFTMGEGSPVTNATPTHPVTVSSFAIDAYEVTLARFRRYWTATPLAHPGPGASLAYPGSVSLPWNGPVTEPATSTNCNWSTAAGSKELHPINCVDWYTAQAFCVWDGGRLPTEAEWEYAARGRAVSPLVVPRAYPWGNETPAGSSTVTCDRAQWNHCAGEDGAATRRVGHFAAVAGIYDQAGNVWEWTADNWTSDYSGTTCWGTGARTNPLCSTSATGDRVDRGGSWYGDAVAHLRSASRGAPVPTARNGDLGFRCARSR